MKKSKLIRLIAVMLVVLMTLASCSSSASTTSAGSTSGTSSTGEKISLTFATSAALNSMDPTLNSSGESMTIINYCTEGLYKTDKDGKLALGMASAVTTSDDGLTWTFTIRDDAYWSNGDKVTSNDFAYSWKRLANPDTGAEYAYMLMVAGIKNAQDVTYNGGSLDSLGIATPDDKTLVVTLDHPVTYLPNLLLGTYFMPEDEKFVEEKGAQFGLSLDDSIFNGQYTLTEWEVGGTEEKMEKNPKYYDADSVTTDELTAKVITDSQQLTMAWENGSVQQISLTGDNVDLYKSNSAFVTTSFPMVYFLSFNTKVSGLDNENLRKAISLSIDKTVNNRLYT
jgi:oligopeptide transport system substrate-binding protein